METNKRNYDVYLDKMEKAMEDKLFFLNHIDINEYDYIIDFGCADGTLASRLGINPNKIILVDKDLKMLELASQKVGTNNLYVDVSEIPAHMIDKKKVLLILSSVLHEMYVENKREIIEFIKKYIHTVVIRDMIAPKIEDIIIPINKEIIKKIIFDSHPYVSFVWANSNKMLTHLDDISEYLLKMDYVENYDLEIEESYFGANLPDFENCIIYSYNLNFETIYKEDFTIPPMIEKQKKYGLPNFRTHRKLILMRKE